MSKERLLIIEDETSVAKQLKWSFDETYEISIAADAKRARKLLASGAFPVATLDLGLPPSPETPEEGLKLLKELGSISPNTRIIVITGNSEQETAVEAVGTGAADFCAKPIDVNILKVILNRAYGLYALEEAGRKVNGETDRNGELCGMIGTSPLMQELFSCVKRVSKTDYPVLVTGESGTGKEMVAKAIHDLSPRSRKPFVIINCGAIPENLLESELFGHERGAFTGAVARKIGKFELADSGSVFLDEIGELPLQMQVKLLRFLQEGTIERIGANGTLPLNVRIIAATNTDLQQAIGQGAFREDLFFRLNVVPVRLPPLRERPEDVAVLAYHFLRVEIQNLKGGRVALTSGALSALASHDWPGNVRELQNRIRRALSISNAPYITSFDLGFDSGHKDMGAETFQTLQQSREMAEQNCIRQALLMTGNNISQAAKLLKISRPTLHDLLRKHRIERSL